MASNFFNFGKSRHQILILKTACPDLQLVGSLFSDARSVNCWKRSAEGAMRYLVVVVAPGNCTRYQVVTRHDALDFADVRSRSGVIMRVIDPGRREGSCRRNIKR